MRTLAAILLLAAPAHAITNGTADAGDPAVAALLIEGNPSCSGTLIAPRVVLTAAHCLSAPPMISFGAMPTAAGSAGVLDARTHPAFDAATLANDIGVLLLDGAAAAMPVALSGTPFDAGFDGRAVRLVGFGRLSSGDISAPEKRQGTTSIDSFTDSDFVVHANPSQPCEGDSGGAAFATIGSSEQLIGVISRGDPSCTQMARQMRVDAFRDFIEGYVAATTPGAAALGQRCYYDANCAAGSCVVAADEPRLQYCTRPCGSDGDCASGMKCTSSSCRWPAPTPGALGSRCTQAADCVSDLCARPSPGAPSTCSADCFTDLPNSCPSGYDCRANADGAGDACFPQAHGCAFGGDAPDAWLAFALLLIARAIAAARR